MAEKFNLKWNDYNSNVLKTFRRIREDEDLFDVTFACDDQQQISAHKLVLSSSSEYFKNIFKHNKLSHPLLCVLDISSSEMKNILDYIYFGEATIDKDNIERFLIVSKRLKIEGLTNLERDQENLEVEETGFIKQESEETEFEDLDDIEDNNKDITTEISHEKKKKKKHKMKIVNSDEIQNTNELNQKLSEHIERFIGKSFKCKVCEKICNYRLAAMEHVQLHFSGLSFPCNICNTNLKTTAAHRQHMKNSHGDKESKPVLKMDQKQDEYLG